MRSRLARRVPPDVLRPACIARTLVEVTSRALRGQDCADLAQTRRFRLSSQERRLDRVAHCALWTYELSSVNSETIAEWIVDQYAPRPYPAVIFGSPHGGGAHLAAALAVPWLPAGYDIDVQWPAGASRDVNRAIRHGVGVAHRLLEGNIGVTVRHVHDPVRLGRLSDRLSRHHLRWCELPRAYVRFLRAALAAGGTILVMQDVRQWPVLDVASTASFQLGSPAVGVAPDVYPRALRLRGIGALHAAAPQYAETAIEPALVAELAAHARRHGSRLARVLYCGPDILSGAVADLYRTWLRGAGKTGDRVIVECGRLLDPYQVRRAGLVPYWCENASRAAARSAELWLAGSEPFTSVDVIAEPPGVVWPAMARTGQWEGIAAFASRRGRLDRRAARAYPLRPLAPRDATRVLRRHPYDLPLPAPLPVSVVLDALAAAILTH